MNRSRVRNGLQADFKRFLRYFKIATKEIGEEYIQLPVAGKETPDYRERVYCYELYHQLRLAIPDGFSYTLSGEVDKGRHPSICGETLKDTIPDFLLHDPGTMGRNLTVIEVKPIVTARRTDRVKRDLEKLCAFRCLDEGKYASAIYLIYGQGGNDALRLIRENVTTLDSAHEQIDLTLIEFYHHGKSGQPAERLDWSRS